MERILLIDPNSAALSRAATNLIYNNLAGCCSFETAFVSDRSGETVPFYTVGAGAAGSMYKGHAQTAAAAGSVMQVPTTTIDALAARQSWAPDFIKIDVEGAE
ncbi:MAG: FkbM family methyltransferase, partial [Deltaproteobacteria bacterium]